MRQYLPLLFLAKSVFQRDHILTVQPRQKRCVRALLDHDLRTAADADLRPKFRKHHQLRCLFTIFQHAQFLSLLSDSDQQPAQNHQDAHDVDPGLQPSRRLRCRKITGQRPVCERHLHTDMSLSVPPLRIDHLSICLLPFVRSLAKIVCLFRPCAGRTDACLRLRQISSDRKITLRQYPRQRHRQHRHRRQQP